MSFWAQYWHVITFYSLVGLLIYLNRNKFEFEGKIVGLLRTNTGLAWMNKYGKKHSKALKIISEVGVWVGFAGMIIILGYLGYGAYQLIAEPAAPPVVSPVLPGITIPGTGITVPLFAGLLALFIVVVVHEAAHGLIAAAHKIKVKSSGVGFIGPIPVAFVEPDEKKIEKATPRTQLRIFAAGPWSNIIQAAIAIVLVIGMGLAMGGLTQSAGVQFETIQEGSPAALAGLEPNTPYTMINGEEFNNSYQFVSQLQNTTPGQTITLNDQSVTLGEYEDGNACLGVVGITEVQGEEDFRNTMPIIATALLFVQEVIYWVFVLALGLGLANLLPLGPVDGGRMIYHPLVKLFGEEKGEKAWMGIAKGLLILLLILLVVPIIKAFIGPAVTALSCMPV